MLSIEVLPTVRCTNEAIVNHDRGCMAEEGDSLYSIRAYFQNQGGGNDGLHAPINNWFYWCWNANSGDTGGIVRACLSPPVHA